MRVTKKTDGTYIVQDAPMQLGGRAAKRFIADLNRRDSADVAAKRAAFLDECRRIYDSNKND